MSTSGGSHVGGGDVNSVNSVTPDGAGNVDLVPADIGAPSTSDLTTGLAGKADLVGGVVPTSQIPALAITSVTEVASEAAMLALAAQVGDVAARTDQGNALYMLGADDPTVLANWIATAGAGTGVTSVNGQTGVVVLAAADVNADASGAAAAAQDYAIQRAHHTGTQTLATISDAGTAAAVDTGTAVGDVPVIGAGGQLDPSIVPAAPLASLSGSLATKTTLTNTPTTLLTVSGLTAGTWLITAAVTVSYSSSGTKYAEAEAVAGTGAPTLAGQTSAVAYVVNNGDSRTMPLAFLATCTSDSTVSIQCVGPGGGLSADSTSPNSGYANATGFTAVKIA